MESLTSLDVVGSSEGGGNGVCIGVSVDAAGVSSLFTGGGGVGSGTSLVAGEGSSVTSTGGRGTGALFSGMSSCGDLICITSSPSSSGCCFMIT